MMSILHPILEKDWTLIEGEEFDLTLYNLLSTEIIRDGTFSIALERNGKNFYFDRLSKRSLIGSKYYDGYALSVPSDRKKIVFKRDEIIGLKIFFDTNKDVIPDKFRQGFL